MSLPRQRGLWGEAMASLYLESRGYHILQRRFRSARQELDLIAERGDLVVVVEVKWRRAGSSLEQAVEAWRTPQRARAREATLAAMATIERGRERPWRFDLITIEEEPRGLRLTHRPGAWAPAGSWW